jgi:hypothetical protein
MNIHYLAAFVVAIVLNYAVNAVAQVQIGNVSGNGRSNVTVDGVVQDQGGRNQQIMIGNVSGNGSANVTVGKVVQRQSGKPATQRKASSGDNASGSSFSDGHVAGLAREEYALPAGIERVVIETLGDMEIRLGTEARLIVKAEPEVLRQLDNSPVKDTLFLRSKGSFSTQQGVHYELVLPRLRVLASKGSGDIALGAFSGETLDVDLAGSGSVRLDGVEFERLDLKVSGSGDIAATGRGRELHAEIAGSGNIHAENYVVTRAKAEVGGSGGISVHPRERLETAIAGAGDIRYRGNPAVTRTTATGAGSVEPF